MGTDWYTTTTTKFQPIHYGIQHATAYLVLFSNSWKKNSQAKGSERKKEIEKKEGRKKKSVRKKRRAAENPNCNADWHTFPSSEIGIPMSRELI